MFVCGDFYYRLTFLMAVKYTDYNICTFNCHGMKGSLEYVLELASSHDVLFINEHWLQQKDIHTICSITETNNPKLWTYLKSSVDPSRQLNGRPYGGLGFLCRRTSGRFFKVIEHESDRVLGVQIFDNKTLIMTVIGVYLPYDNNTLGQTELYIETLDQVQHLIETVGNSKPLFMFWNLIRSTKQNPNAGDAIDTETLVKYFKQRFSDPAVNSNVLDCARRDVCTKYTTLVNTKHSDAERRNIIVSVANIKKYINQLKRNSAAGYDGITAEHLMYAMDSNLPLHFSCLFSLCICYGIIPDQFNNGLLVPIIKKATSDPSIPSSYRPITISCVLWKILELYILDHCDFGINKAQFGYVKDCDANMATTLAHDIGSYCVSNGTTVFYCSLDAQGLMISYRMQSY